MKVCLWTEDDNGVWETSCKQMFVLNEGTPEQNHMKFCCYCGTKLKQKIYNDEEETK